jgi:hypothetical protein
MATPADVKRIALGLPDTAQDGEHFRFTVRSGATELKAFAWSWKERIHPRKARVENLGVLAIRVANLVDKDVLIRSDPEKFFTEPHYDGYPAVLVRLAKVRVPELRRLLDEARKCQVQATRRPRGARETSG